MGRGESCVDQRFVLDEVARSGLDAELPDLDQLDFNRGPALLKEAAAAIEQFELRRGVDDLKQLLAPALTSRRAVAMLKEEPLPAEAERLITAVAQASYFHPEDPTIQRLFREAATAVGVVHMYTPLLVGESSISSGYMVHGRESRDSVWTLCSKRIGEDWTLGTVRGEMSGWNGCDSCGLVAEDLPDSDPARAAVREDFSYRVVPDYEVERFHGELLGWMRETVGKTQSPAEILRFFTSKDGFDGWYRTRLSQLMAEKLLLLAPGARLEQIFELPPTFTEEDELHILFKRLKEAMVSEYGGSVAKLRWPQADAIQPHVQKALEARQGGRYTFVAALVGYGFPEAAKRVVALSQSSALGGTSAEIIDALDRIIS